MVGNVKYIVRLGTSEQEALEGLVNKGKVAAAKRKRAHILLKANANAEGPAWTDEQIAEALDVSVATIHRTRQAYVAQGLEVSLEHQRPLGRPFRKLDGAQEARLVAIACSPAPEGHARWTLTLLADKMVTLEIVEAIGKETVRRTLKKNDIKPWLKEQWVLPKEGNADFVCAMEDVLEVYTRPYNAQRPVVCLDEASKQLVADVTPPVPMQPGHPARQDYEYERCGTANLFMLFEPLAGQRHVKVTEQRTNADLAVMLREVADVTYADADKIVLVMDNLNTHKLAVLYQVYPPEEARRLYERFEVHHTPKHASWLNMAETELSVLGRQCLDRRIANQELLRREVAAWENTRNRAQVRVDWQFTTADARIKLKRLYPKLEPVN